jgi:hypothetical protein
MLGLRSRGCAARWVGWVLLGSGAVACGDDAVAEGDALELCSDPEELSIALELGPCEDEACAEPDIRLWHGPAAVAGPESFEMELACTAMPDAGAGERWRLVDCEGTPAVEHGLLVRLQGSLGDGLALTAGETVHAAYVRESAELLEWSAATLRDETGDLIAAMGNGNRLPRSELTEPLTFMAGQAECEPQAGPCGGLNWPGLVHVELDEATQTVASGATAVIGDDASYAIAVTRAVVSVDNSCGGSSIWTTFDVVALAL